MPRIQKYQYGTQVEGSWYWYEPWLNEVRKHCMTTNRSIRQSRMLMTFHRLVLIFSEEMCVLEESPHGLNSRKQSAMWLGAIQ
jgi:hypothetical protein